jgi:hypothetical protein
VRFHGIHRKELLGVAATGMHVWWYGVPMFTFEGWQGARPLGTW